MAIVIARSFSTPIRSRCQVKLSLKSYSFPPSKARVKSLALSRPTLYQANSRVRVRANRYNSGLFENLPVRQTVQSQEFSLSPFTYCLKTSSDYSLAEAFGIDASANADYLVIQKADLELESGIHSAKELMLAIILHWVAVSNLEKRIRIKYWRLFIVNEFNQSWEKRTFLISLSVPESGQILSFSPRSFLV